MKNTLWKKLAPWKLRHKWALFAEHYLPVSAKQHRDIFNAMLRTERSLQNKIKQMEGACPSKSVYIVVCNDGERVKDSIVFSDCNQAQAYFRVCREMYGGANVALVARAIDDVPRYLRESKLAQLERLVG